MPLLRNPCPLGVLVGGKAHLPLGSRNANNINSGSSLAIPVLWHNCGQGLAAAWFPQSDSAAFPGSLGTTQRVSLKGIPLLLLPVS